MPIYGSNQFIFFLHEIRHRDDCRAYSYHGNDPKAGENRRFCARGAIELAQQIAFHDFDLFRDYVAVM
jgi:hypothetical protein